MSVSYTHLDVYKRQGYGFNKSHSVAYGLVAYQTAYLKAHWPAEFFAALITSVIDVYKRQILSYPNLSYYLYKSKK